MNARRWVLANWLNDWISSPIDPGFLHKLCVFSRLLHRGRIWRFCWKLLSQLFELPLNLVEPPLDLSMFACDEKTDTVVLLAQDGKQLRLQLSPCVARRTLSWYCDWIRFDVRGPFLDEVLQRVVVDIICHGGSLTSEKSCVTSSAVLTV